MHQFGYRMRIEAEMLFRDHGDEAGTGLESRVVELAIALILLEMSRIGRGQKSALVVIEPPGDFGRAGVFEINDGILIAVELFFVEKSARAMEKPGVDELRVIANPLPVKAAEQGCRRSAVETLIVIKDTHSQDLPSFPRTGVKNNYVRPSPPRTPSIRSR